MADANYRFIYVNIGAKGSASDGGIFNACSLSNALLNNSLNIPNNRALAGRTAPVPYCIVADDAFTTSQRVMKPVPGQNLSRIDRVYNYRLSRARRVIENSFGIASARWRVLRKKFEQKPKIIEVIVSAVCVLHNYCMRHQADLYAPPFLLDREINGELVQGSWHDIDNMISLQHINEQNDSIPIEMIRNEYREYFTSQAGELAWQYDQ